MNAPRHSRVRYTRPRVGVIVRACQLMVGLLFVRSRPTLGGEECHDRFIGRFARLPDLRWSPAEPRARCNRGAVAGFCDDTHSIISAWRAAGASRSSSKGRHRDASDPSRVSGGDSIPRCRHFSRHSADRRALRHAFRPPCAGPWEAPRARVPRFPSGKASVTRLRDDQMVPDEDDSRASRRRQRIQTRRPVKPAKPAPKTIMR